MEIRQHALVGNFETELMEGVVWPQAFRNMPTNVGIGVGAGRILVIFFLIFQNVPKWLQEALGLLFGPWGALGLLYYYYYFIYYFFFFFFCWEGGGLSGSWAIFIRFGPGHMPAAAMRVQNVCLALFAEFLCALGARQTAPSAML